MIHKKMTVSFLLILTSIFFLTSCASSINNSASYYLYFSDSMEKFKTTGSVVSVGDKIEVIRKTGGLELGRIIISNKNIMFNDVNNFYSFDSKKGETVVKKRKFNEFTGQYFSILNEQPIQVFNSGYNNQGQYVTRFYFNNSTLEINEFMKSMGENADSLFSIGEEDNSDYYIISQYKFLDDEISRVKLGTIPINEDEYIIGDIIYFNNLLYTLYEKDNKIQLLEYNINSSKSTIIDMDIDMSIEDIPFSNSNFTYIRENIFTFISSIGNLYQYDLTNKELLDIHHLDLDFSSNFIIDWGLENTPIIATYNDNQDILLSSFDFNNFKIKTLKEINVHSLTTSGHLYDFKVAR